MKIASFEFNLFGVNTYLVWDEQSKHAAIIDPGMSNATEQYRLMEFIHTQNLHIIHLIYTHLHIDHTLGHDFITGQLNITAEAHPSDDPLGKARNAQAKMFHLPTPELKPVTADVELSDGDIITIGHERLYVITIPGHTPGSIALYCKESGFVITGDALFNRSIGRTDLPGGDYNELISSIRTKLLSLPSDTIVYPGHGPTTKIGYEAQFNPFLR